MNIEDLEDYTTVRCNKDTEEELCLIRLLEVNMYDYYKRTDETNNKIIIFYINDADDCLEKHLDKIVEQIKKP